MMTDQNHEVWTTCMTCGNEYDLRDDVTCPDCGKQ